MWKKMNLPNKLTIIRIILIPIFVVFMSLTELVWPIWVAFGIFVVAALTDMIDGQIARKKGLVTKFGKIMDPLADKLLISTAFILLSGLGVIPAWITVIIVFRDFFVNALRMFGADKGKDLSADISGKIKTIFQLVGLSLAILTLFVPSTAYLGSFIFAGDLMGPLEMLLSISMTISICIAVIATIWSFISYLIRFKESINVEE